MHPNGYFCSDVVKNLVRRKLKLQLDLGISTAHRLDKPPVAWVPHNRNIIVRFCQRDTKSQVHQTARVAKVSDFYVNESLKASVHDGT